MKNLQQIEERAAHMISMFFDNYTENKYLALYLTKNHEVVGIELLEIYDKNDKLILPNLRNSEFDVFLIEILSKKHDEKELTNGLKSKIKQAYLYSKIQ